LYYFFKAAAGRKSRKTAEENGEDERKSCESPARGSAATKQPAAKVAAAKAKRNDRPKADGAALHVFIVNYFIYS
jgi:hypothetical protein